MPADVYYISGLPTDVQAGDVAMIAAGRLGDGLRRHDLSRLARRAHGPGGGAAL